MNQQQAFVKINLHLRILCLKLDFIDWTIFTWMDEKLPHNIDYIFKVFATGKHQTLFL